MISELFNHAEKAEEFICKGCLESKPVSEFYATPLTKRGHHSKCKACTYAMNRSRRWNDPDRYRSIASKSNKKWRDRNPDKVSKYYWKRHLRKTYGISIEQHEAMIIAQNGQCAICGRTPETKLYVDHCHESGGVRGLLCSQCNSALGMFGEDAAVLIKAAEYLKSAKQI